LGRRGRIDTRDVGGSDRVMDDTVVRRRVWQRESRRRRSFIEWSSQDMRPYDGPWRFGGRVGW